MGVRREQSSIEMMSGLVTAPDKPFRPEPSDTPMMGIALLLGRSLAQPTEPPSDLGLGLPTVQQWWVAVSRGPM